MLEFESSLGNTQTEESNIQDFLLSHITNYTELYNLSRVVASGINLRDKYNLELKPQTEQILITHLANSLYLSAKYLNLPMPDGVGFIQDKKGVPNRAVNNGLYIAGESSRPVGFPNGLIGFSPFSLTTSMAHLIENEINLSEANEGIRNIAKLASHEIYHLKQRRDIPDELDFDLNILETEGLAAWGETKSEKLAVEFEEVFGNAYTLSLPKINLII